MKLPLTGGCQCGAVRYQSTVPAKAIYACHCTECQRQSGSAFGSSMLVPRDAFSFTRGVPKTWVRTADSGRKVDCLFCPDCGTRIVHMPQHSPTMAIVRAGTLDDTTGIHLAGHIWTNSRQPWFQAPLGTLNYDQQPPDMSKLIEVYAGMQA